MPTVSLPEQPSFEQLRKQAKDLRRAVRTGAPEALAEVAERYPDGWYSRFPAAGGPADTGTGLAGTETGLADTFLRLACLSYADDPA